MKPLFFLNFLLALFLSGCTSISNEDVNSCDFRIISLNTGLNLDGNSSINVLSDGARDNKWVFCFKGINDANNLTCLNTSPSLAKMNSFIYTGLWNSNSITTTTLPPPQRSTS